MDTNNDFVNALLANQDFLKGLSSRLDFAKADTISQATGLNWYDLRPVVQLMYPFKELIPLISKLPRVPGDGGIGYHWKRITGININTLSAGIGEGQRGARITATEEDQQATYKTLGLESSVTFQAGWANGRLTPNNRSIATQATLRALMIAEEQSLVLGNASQALAQTPTPALTMESATGSGAWGTTSTVYVMAVSLTGFGNLNTTPYNSSAGTGGVPGQVTKTNADGSTNTFGGGSAKPSAEASIATVLTGNTVTATIAANPGAVATAWFVGIAPGAETLAGITQGNRATFTKTGALLQPITALQVSNAYQDNSVNQFLPDGIIPMMYNQVFGAAPGTPMATTSQLPNGISLLNSGSLAFTGAAGNKGLSISGTNITEFDQLLQAAYEQYKLGFDKVLMSAADIANFSGTFFGSGDAASAFRIVFDAEAASGRIVAGRRVTSYLNKFFGNTLDIEIHPYLPQGTILFWSDRVPYELSGVANILEAHIRQDYYEVQWPWSSMRFEFGVYVDEVFASHFMPAFGMIQGINPPSGVPIF